MEISDQLFLFLLKLIQVQIEKYDNLVKIGIGPDANLSAALVYNEVTELLKFANLLLQDIELNRTFSFEDVHFNLVFEGIKFYLEQEYARAYAGWLLDENPIHNKAYNRVISQIKELKEMADSVDISFSEFSLPQSPVQQQYLYDSAAIAFFILQLAENIKNNPSMELTGIPKHAQTILKKHAENRYIVLAEEIEKALIPHQKIVESDNFKKSTLVLTINQVNRYKLSQLRALKRVREDYNKIKAPLSLVSTPKHAGFSVRNLSIFGGVTSALVGGMLLVTHLLPYIMESQLQTETPAP